MTRLGTKSLGRQLLTTHIEQLVHHSLFLWRPWHRTCFGQPIASYSVLPLPPSNQHTFDCPPVLLSSSPKPRDSHLWSLCQPSSVFLPRLSPEYGCTDDSPRFATSDTPAGWMMAARPDTFGSRRAGRDEVSLTKGDMCTSGFGNRHVGPPRTCQINQLANIEHRGRGQEHYRKSPELAKHSTLINEVLSILTERKHPIRESTTAIPVVGLPRYRSYQAPHANGLQKMIQPPSSTTPSMTTLNELEPARALRRVRALQQRPVLNGSLPCVSRPCAL